MIRRSTVFLMLALALASQEDPLVLLKQADADLDAGKYSAAIDKGQRAARAFEQASKSKERAHSLTTAGLALMYSGQYTPAIEHFETALRIARDLRDFGPEIARQNDIGNAFYFRGQYAEALRRYREASERVRQVPNDKWTNWGRQLTTANIAILYQTVGQYDQALSLYSSLLSSGQTLAAPEQAQMLSNIGVLRRRLGDPQKALDTYRSAQALYRKAASRDGEISVLNNIGIVQAMDFNDYKLAEATFTQSLRLGGESGNRPLALHAVLYRGEARYRAGEIQEAAVDFRFAATQAKELGQEEEEWKALFGLARIAKLHGDQAEASALLRDAVSKIESLRLKAGTSSLRSTFLADKRAVYDLLIEGATDAKDVFHWMEESRARSLKDRRQASRSPSLEEVQRSLEPDTAVLEYWMGEHSAAVVWFTRSSVGIHRWSPDARESAALEAAPGILANPSRTDWKTQLDPLRDLISEIPVLADPGIQRLQIVPDGALTKFPFEILPFRSGLLVERFAISYAPSIGIVSSASSRLKLRWPWTPTLTALADPRAGTASRDASLSATRIWVPLPQARTEAQAVSTVLGGRAGVHLGPDATKRWLITPNAPILHLATHAVADPANPDLSYILLSPDSPDQQYGYVFLKEVESLSLSGLDLVMLSACETTAGKIVPGEGVRSLSEAMLSAGAKSTVASLWKVGDQSTKELMTRFYSGLADGLPVADALRKAKLEFIANPASAHPAHWAAFILAGDAGWTLPRLVSWWCFGLGAILIATFGYALVRLKQG